MITRVPADQPGLHTACPICAGATRRRFTKHDYWIRGCDVCHHRFAELMPAEDHVERIYDDDYFQGGGAGYLYDASTFPTFLGPLARAYYFMTTCLDAAERQQRKLLYGSLRDGLRPLNPYCWRLEEGELLEIPVTTMPLVKLPIHVSYLLYLSVFAPALAVLYFNTALGLCRWTRTRPSLLLHPLDFLGCDDHLPELAFFPAMGLPRAKKLHLVSRALRLLSAQYTVLPMGQYAREMARNLEALARVEPTLPGIEDNGMQHSGAEE